MKCNRLLLLLAAEAVLCATAAIFSRQLAGLFPALLSFPFAQIGMGLRALSLSGVAGNAAAIVLYILCCFLPLILLLIFGWGRRLHGEDALLFLLSAVLFPALYLLINPGTMSAGPSPLRRGADWRCALLHSACLGGPSDPALFFPGGSPAASPLRLYLAGGPEHLLCLCHIWSRTL